MNRIEIWQPRYKDNVALIAKYKVKEENEVVFTKAKHLKGRVFRISGSQIRTCPIDTNGRIACYAVPMDILDIADSVESA